MSSPLILRAKVERFDGGWVIWLGEHGEDGAYHGFYLHNDGVWRNSLCTQKYTGLTVKEVRTGWYCYKGDAERQLDKLVKQS